MFNLGFTEIMVISGVALLFFGPKRLPELAKGLGRGIRDFKKALEGGGDDKKDDPSDFDKKTPLIVPPASEKV